MLFPGSGKGGGVGVGGDILRDHVTDLGSRCGGADRKLRTG